MSKHVAFQPGVRYLQTCDVLKRFGICRFTLQRWYTDERVGFPKPIRPGARRRNYYSETEILRWEMTQAGLDPDGVSHIGGYKAVSKLITDYDEFVQGMIKRRQSLKFSLMEVDARSGMHEGYTTKLENYERENGRGMGPEIMPLWLGGLKLGIILVELPRTTRNFRDKARPPITGE